MTVPRGRVRAVTGHERVALTGWELCASAPGAIAGPDALPASGWTAAAGPSTAAAALRAAGQWSLDGPVRRFDAEDWWWRARVELPAAEAGEVRALCLDGLATYADVWWNGAHVLASDDMFVAHEVELGAGGAGGAGASVGELVIRCRSLDAELAKKRPRPRWRVPMIEQQQLRWARTTLLGRTPGWSPPAPPVGPWRDVRVERRRGVIVDGVRVRAAIVDGAGVVAVVCRARAAASGPVAVELVVARDGVEHRAALSATDPDPAPEDGGASASHAGRVAVPEPARWWPHTHGEPACYAARLEVRHGAGEVAVVELGPVGFRTLALATAGDDFALSVNGARVFCRGAVWTPIDPVALTAPAAAVDAAIAQAAACGMNMLRVGGTMVYEDAAFHDACDARGVLVWQDLMLANLDYPDGGDGADAAFVATLGREVREQLAALAGRPSLAIVCGGSEVEQQAAMWGAPRERWAPYLAHTILPAIAAAAAPEVPYWPSSAHGGAYPHAPNAGTSSYYGVGAYLRPLDDARRSEVRFASECLAFANVPAARALPPGLRVHHAAWKARAPRDLGAGWDFDDVRDHYVRELFGVDPAALRYADHDRYLALGRVATGEVMAAAMGEWRRARSVCRGALIWFLRDLWSGAGWGVVDAGGAPKPAWYFLRRALAPVGLAISDEGLSGLAIHAVNDRGAPLAATLELALWRAGEVAVGGAKRAVEVPAHGALEVPAAALFDHFLDLSYAHRFGPPGADLIVATLRGAAGEALAEAWHFPVGRPRARELDVGLAAVAQLLPGGDALVTVRARRFAYAVALEADGWLADDDFFHLAPGDARTVRLARVAGARPLPLKGTATALNAEAAARFEVKP